MGLIGMDTHVLGALLIAACFGYLADSLTRLLLPTYANPVPNSRTSR
jgi:hypothetical protein